MIVIETLLCDMMQTRLKYVNTSIKVAFLNVGIIFACVIVQSLQMWTWSFCYQGRPAKTMLAIRYILVFQAAITSIILTLWPIVVIVTVSIADAVVVTI